MCLSLSLLQLQLRNLSLNEQVSVCLTEALASLFIQHWHLWRCLFTGRADFSFLVVITTFSIFWGLFNIFWGRLLLLPITIIFWPIRKRGFGPFTIADMINPQWGLIQCIIYQIIIRIHFAVTLFQQVTFLGTTPVGFARSWLRWRSWVLSDSISSRGLPPRILPMDWIFLPCDPRCA